MNSKLYVAYAPFIILGTIEAGSIPVVGFNAVLMSEHFGSFLAFGVLHAAMGMQYIKVGACCSIQCFTAWLHCTQAVSLKSLQSLTKLASRALIGCTKQAHHLSRQVTIFDTGLSKPSVNLDSELYLGPQSITRSTCCC